MGFPKLISKMKDGPARAALLRGRVSIVGMGMSKVVKCKTLDGKDVEFVDEIIGSGAVKDVYFSPDKSYVVGFYREKQDAQAKDRLQMIAGKYREGIFNNVGGEYWKNLLCWPTSVLEYDGRLGIVAPAYDHTNSTLRWRSRSRRLLDGTRFKYP
ncbi:hypothetical protein [Paraburkholderia hospita]|uniref:hypothetical protein n=1 Tax=Paraburkholderia hospita TaxID=169430 RepID=UPI001A985FC6|nr:hypothetical protein [Paraburkholderia hospita]